MQPKKLSPLEILQKQKTDLQVRADVLSNTLENRVKYLQQNFTPLLCNSLIQSAASKLPPKMQNLAGKLVQKERNADNQGVNNTTVNKLISGIAIGVAVIVPIIISKKKGTLFSSLLKQVIKFILA